MALTHEQINQLAIELSGVRRTASLIEQPSKRYPGFSLEEGYAIGKKLEQRQVTEGHAVSGKKIGFTNQAIWPSAGLNQPLWAPMYRDTIRRAAELSLQGMAAPRIETEIVFFLGKDLTSSSITSEEILQAMRWYSIGFEIVDCHYPGWRYTPADLLADFGFHAALVLGEPRPVQSAKASALAGFTISLYSNEQMMAKGTGTDVLGSPVLAIHSLIVVLRGMGIAGLKAGETITTGTLTGALPILPGQTWRAEASGLDLPPLSVRFT